MLFGTILSVLKGKVKRGISKDASAPISHELKGVLFPEVFFETSNTAP